MTKPPLERAARAMCSLQSLPENTKFEGRPMWESFLPIARVALGAIREPSEAMIGAGAEIIRNVHVEESDAAFASDAANTWRFMIDAALSECP